MKINSDLQQMLSFSKAGVLNWRVATHFWVTVTLVYVAKACILVVL